MDIYSDKLQLKVKALFQQRFNITLSEKEILECCQNLSDLGRARVRFHALQKQKYGKSKLSKD